MSRACHASAQDLSGGVGLPATHAPAPLIGPRLRFRTIFLSDIHLGSRGCDDRGLADFLDHVDCDTLYLVGDIIDVWQMKRRFYWTDRHSAIVRRIIDTAKGGTQVIYVPGNHDEEFRSLCGSEVGGVQILSRAFHETADGRQLLVMHGDEFDAVVMGQRWLPFLGDAAYDFLIGLNVRLNGIRRRLGLPYWSLAKYVKRKVERTVDLVSKFEEAARHQGQKTGVDGIVCGHIHTPGIRRHGDVTYHNCGDWMASSTALVEHDDGSMEILHWTEEMLAREASASPVRRAA